MKILFVCHRLPYPPNRGGKIRPFNMIRHLSKRHAVVVASLAESEHELREGADLKSYCDDVIAEVLPVSTRWLQACKALFTKTPSSVAYFWSSRLHRRIQAKVRDSQFDVVMAHCAFVAQYIMHLDGAGRYIDFGDLDSGKWFDYSQHRSPPLSWGYGLEAKKLRAYEKQVAERFHHCTVTTEGELDEFHTLDVSVPCRVIPNGVDSAYFRRQSLTPADSSVIVFLGRMDYFPNVDGVLYFTKEIFPLICQSLPQAKLRIIGSNPTRAIRNLAKIPSISVTGYVPDVRPYLRDAAVAIAPLRIARGTQNKLLESMAMGVPIVSTPEAAKGVQAISGTHLAVASGTEMFAKEVIRVIQNAAQRQQFSDHGHRLIEEEHAWPLSMARLDEVLTRTHTIACEAAVKR